MCNQWISVEDELPEVGTSVLVCTESGDDGLATLEEWKSGYGFRWDGFGSIVYSPTHWMFFPDKPED